MAVPSTCIAPHSATKTLRFVEVCSSVLDCHRSMSEFDDTPPEMVGAQDQQAADNVRPSMNTHLFSVVLYFYAFRVYCGIYIDQA